MSKARLMGYDAVGHVVYAEVLDLGEYYDGDHVWDTSEGILRLRLVRLIGELREDDRCLQRFETRFSAETGDYIGSIAVHESGQVVKHGEVPESVVAAFLSYAVECKDETAGSEQMTLPL